MSSLKNVLVIAVLLGVGYAVYTTINSQPGSAPAPDQTDGWPTSVDVQLPKGKDSKSAAAANPFATRSDQTADRVPARDADPFSLPRGGSSRDGQARRQSGLGDRASPRSSRSPEGPGEAVSTDMSPGAPSSPPDAAPTRRPDRADPGPRGVRPEFAAMVQDAQKRLANGELAEVHLALSRLYGNPDMTAEESVELTDLLDQLAGTVIYSRRHLLEPPYEVKPGDSLHSIAQSHNVPWQLLAKINGIREPDRLQPGGQLKVLRGPFEAVVSLERYELVLMLGGRYAGRFPIGIGRDVPQLEGSYTVKKKVAQPTYVGPDRTLEPGDPSNPLGKLAIELADRIAIHGTNDIRNLRRSDGRGTICLGPRDIEDLFDILSAGPDESVASRVTVRR